MSPHTRERAGAVVDEVWADLSDRRGLGLSEVDEDVRQEIHWSLVQIVARHLEDVAHGPLSPSQAKEPPSGF